MSANLQNKSNPAILTLNIKDKNSLYAAYMPFIKNGGLFIPTKKKYVLGEEIFLLLTLPDSNERLPVSGKVIWITPANSQGGRNEGVGVQFSNQDSGETKKRIDNNLLGLPEMPRNTM